ncbi:Mur ligase family protein [Lentibacillus saliphilus]|uniref:Mur ligase family protein n=1 Tax=Lentibacillus saliphilus TaxID=2737028 RepID=UPI001C2F7E2E|nr:UDP-N-acetylmuramyl-tripeptide synthetase [Lentibacillus saliphilus]
MNLQLLLDKIDIIECYEPIEAPITGISYHSQRVEPGHLFVCILGYKTDGHQYLSNAVANGAKAAIVQTIQKDISIPQYKVKNSRAALAQLSVYYYGNPSERMNMIGITATNGKTTTAYMTNAILEANKLTTGLIGTVNVKIGDTSYPAELTTPESLESQYFLKRMSDKHVSHVTMEVSSAAQHMHRTDHIDFDIVTFNNIGREHIDTHGSFANYVAAKSQLIKHAKKDAFAILNLDDEVSASLADQTNAHVITFSVNKRIGHLTCKHLDMSKGRPSFTVELLKPIRVNEYLSYEPMEFNIDMAVPGIHSVYNSMVAITIGLLLGIPIPVIQKALKSFEGVERRFQFIHDGDIKILDDHFANPGNIDITMATLQRMDHEQLHLVYAIRGQRGPVVNRENAESIVKWAKTLDIHHIIATKSISHVTDRDMVTQEEEEAFLEVMSKAGMTVTLFDDLPDAIHASLKEAKHGDLVLLAGCQGMDAGADIVRAHIKSAIT